MYRKNIWFIKQIGKIDPGLFNIGKWNNHEIYMTYTISYYFATKDDCKYWRSNNMFINTDGLII